MKMQLIKKKLTEIKPYKRNPRINDNAVEAVKESIRQCEYVAPIVVDENGVILAGHTRYKALKEMGVDEIEVCVKSGLTDEQKKKYRILDNKTAELADWDFDLLSDELNSIDDLDMSDFGFDFDIDEDETGEIVEDDYDAEPPVEPKAKLGDIYQLGRHRLMCGDSTDREQVERLMNGEKADMVFTDPPYGVNVKGGAGKDKNGKILGDLTQTAIPFSFEIAVEYATKPKAHFYWCGGESNLEMYSKLFNRYLNILPKHLIWVKNGFSMKQVGYHNQYEIIYFGYKVGSGGLWYGGRTEDEASDVWQINKEKTHNYLHPTQKPIELVARAIKNSCPKNGIVLDMFGGSGSTLIACEQLEKQCCIMELDPRYADTIISRWEQFTGKKAVKVNG